jgi:hypothetical protein
MAGIDSIINTRAQAFTNNPQGLMQRYAMGQDLLDLLALQKLKQDKEAAQRDLQMKMQAPQGTVKDQLEGQVMDMTRQEVAQAVAPGLQQMGQRMAAEQAPQEQAAAGLGALPAPAALGMAEGGIVGYAGERGSYVSQDAYRRLKEKERARRERESNAEAAAALEDAYQDSAEAQYAAALPYSSESALQDLLNKLNRGEAAPESGEPAATGPGSVAPNVSVDALRRFDAQRRAERDAEARSPSGIERLADAVGWDKSQTRELFTDPKAQWDRSQLKELLTDPGAQWGRSVTKKGVDYVARLPAAVDLPAGRSGVRSSDEGFDRKAAEAAAAASQAQVRSSPLYEGIARLLNTSMADGEVASSMDSPAGRRKAAARAANLQYHEDAAERTQLTNQIAEIYGKLGGVFGDFIPQSDADRALSQQVMDALPTMSTAQMRALLNTGKMPTPETESVTPTPEDIANTEANVAAMTEGLPALVRQGTPTRGTPTRDEQAAYLRSLSSTPGAARTFNRRTLAPEVGATVPPMTDVATKAPQEPYRSRYEDQLAALEAEKKDKMGALIDFLLAAGASGGTNLGATLTGGGTGLQQRSARLKQEEADILKSIIADEQNQQLMDYRERDLAQRGAESAADRASRERMSAADIAAQRYNADLDFEAAMANVDANQFNSLLDYQQAIASQAAASGKAVLDAMKDRQLTPAQRNELLTYFDENMAESVRATLAEQIQTKGKGKLNTAEAQQLIEDGVTAERNKFLLQRINEVSQSYGDDPIFAAADQIIGG